MDENVVLCVVCAWRDLCNKKFSLSSIEIFDCPDFTRDATITISSFEELNFIINYNKNYRVN